MGDYVEGLNAAAFLLRYTPEPLFEAGCDEVCQRYGCLRGDCFTTDKPAPVMLEDGYAHDVVGSNWRAAYEADAYEAQLRNDRDGR